MKVNSHVKIVLLYIRRKFSNLIFIKTLHTCKLHTKICHNYSQTLETHFDIFNEFTKHREKESFLARM